MSQGNNMSLSNIATDITLQNYNLIHTNSGDKIAVLAGNSLSPGYHVSRKFDIEKGKDDTFILVFNDPDNKKKGWQGVINTGHQLSSKHTYDVTVKVVHVMDGAKKVGIRMSLYEAGKSGSLAEVELSQFDLGEPKPNT